MTTDRGGSRWILAGVSIALFCVQIDYFAVNLALPRMASELHTSTTDLQWVISVYMLTLGAFMVPAGRIGDIFGRRRIFLFGVVRRSYLALALPLLFALGAVNLLAVWVGWTMLTTEPDLMDNTELEEMAEI